MNKILLFLLILCMVVVNLNNVSAFSDNFSDMSMSDWTLYNHYGTWSLNNQNASTYLLVTSGGGCYCNIEGWNNATILTGETNNYFEINMSIFNPDYTTYSAYTATTSFIFGANNTGRHSSISINRVGDISASGFSYITQDLNINTYYKITMTIINSQITVNIYNTTDNTLINSQTSSFTRSTSSFDRIIIESYAYTYVGGSSTSAKLTSNFDDIIASPSDPNLPSTGSILFDQDSYNLGDIAYIDATLTNPDYASYGYRTIIYNPDGSINHAHMWPSDTTSQTDYPINIENLGTYTVKLQKFSDLFSYTDIDSDSAVGKYQNDALMSVYFNASYYNTGDTVLIQSNISNINNSQYFYEVMIIKPNGNFYNVHNITANETYSFVTNVPGEWTVSLTSYPKSDSAMIENQVSDYMVTYGTGVGASWVAFNDTYYYKNSWARINYGISVNDFYDSHKMQIINQDGTVVFDRQIIAQSGYFDYYFYESGKYTVTIDRNWFAFDWDLTDNEILASDVTEVTNTIAGGFTLGVTPTTLNCGQTVYLSAETPNIWNTSSFQIKNVSGTMMSDISGQAGSWKTNQTGQFWVYLYDAGSIQDTGYFYVYGTCTGYDVMNPDGSGGIKPKPYPKTDQAASNAALQNNLLYFMGLPIFWGMIIFIGVLIIAAVNKAGAAIPYLAPGILLFEAVVGLLDPYSSFIIVGFAIVVVMYFIGNFIANRAGN